MKKIFIFFIIPVFCFGQRIHKVGNTFFSNITKIGIVNSEDIAFFNGVENTLSDNSNKLFWNWIDESDDTYSSVPMWQPEDFTVVIKFYRSGQDYSTSNLNGFFSNLYSSGHGWTCWIRQDTYDRMAFSYGKRYTTGTYSIYLNYSINSSGWQTMVYRYQNSDSTLWMNGELLGNSYTLSAQLDYWASQTDTKILTFYLNVTTIENKIGGVDWIALYNSVLDDDTIARFISDDTFNLNLPTFYDAYLFDDDVLPDCNSYYGTHNGTWFNTDDTTIIKYDTALNWGLF